MDVSKISMPLQAEPSSDPRPRSTPAGQRADSPAPSNPQAPPPISKEKLEAAMAALSVQTNLRVEMSLDEQTGCSVVRIFSEDGKRLLRQIPAEAVLGIAETLHRGGHGALLGSLV